MGPSIDGDINLRQTDEVLPKVKTLHAHKPVSFMIISCEKVICELLVATMSQTRLAGLGCKKRQSSF
jgi:hypothetical protein